MQRKCYTGGYEKYDAKRRRSKILEGSNACISGKMGISGSNAQGAGVMSRDAMSCTCSASNMGRMR